MRRFIIAFCLLWSVFAHAQAPGEVQIAFVPPPLENAAYSLGIYDKSGRLVRRLKEMAPESAFAAGLNGLITRWDRKDDSGNIVPAGRYAARGWAVGGLKIEGVAFHGNDWTEADETLRVVRIDSIRPAPDGRGLLAAATMAGGAIVDLALSPEGEVMAQTPLESAPAAVTSTPGRDQSAWTAEGNDGVTQRGANGEVLRRLAVAPGDPAPRQAVASPGEDRIYLLEDKEGWQRLRALSWINASEENGKPVSTWQTVFERNIRRTDPPGGAGAPKPVTVDLMENPLAPSENPKIALVAGFDSAGSYLQTIDGLRLRQVSERRFLSSARLARGKTLSLFQFDGAAWDEFAITGASEMMSFDAGALELTGAGEKTPPKPEEPPDQ